LNPVLYKHSLECPRDLVGIATASSGNYPYLLDSAVPGPLGKFSLLLRTSDEQLCLHNRGHITGPGSGPGFLSRLQDWYLQQHEPAKPDPDWPFVGGWFLYLGYELAAEIEPTVVYPPADDAFPVAFATRCPGAVYARPEQPGVLHLVAETESLLEQMCLELTSLPPEKIHKSARLCYLSAEPPQQFKDAVSKIHEYILNGDVFQVNLSRGWRGEFDAEIDVPNLYRTLSVKNPAPFAGLVNWQDKVLMSSSPERLVNVIQDKIQARPIAGTRPRGIDSHSDLALSQELLANPKERAEHVMLIDLERNDLGRVCKAGSVEVDELMVVESYEHVHHIVSNVCGRLRANVNPIDVIRAVFPGGTITGCPKVRCMEIVAELEKCGRSYYTGSIGYLGLDGSLDLNILIRSMLIEGRQIGFRTGAGIVADSKPDAEVTETEDKARGLLRALGAPGSGIQLRKDHA